MASLPTGTVTFLFTDIEGSTRLAQQYPDSVAGLLERHHAILNNAIQGHGGYIFQIVGDAFCAAFQTVREALDAAVEAQHCLAAESWSPEPIRVRMGIGTGTAQVKLEEGRPPDYSGYLNLARVQRVMSAGYGGQILLANASAELLRGELPPTVSLRDLGECLLKSLLSPERLWQVVAPGLQSDFPPLQLVSFVGDERPLREIRALLEAHPLKLPPFLQGGVDAQRPVFVTRENELARLEHFLNLALEGRGQVAFITGDPGQGKTALAREFARRAIEHRPDLAFAAGNCDAYTGSGDPYLPFREILALLCGDVEAGWEARAISREAAWRLWQCMPIAVQAIAATGRDLMGTLVSGDLLARQASALGAAVGHGLWFAELDQLLRTKMSAPADPAFQQAALFEQYIRVLRQIAQHKPLLLILDDLQWADSGSINLLSRLVKRIQGSRLMILGTYRTTELAVGRDGQRHPLEPLLNEFKRQFGDIEIDLGESEGRRFVEAIIDNEPNRLGNGFRATLLRVAGGHPLATIELLRDLQGRGGIVHDASDAWIEGPSLDWDALPARVEAMIAERIERLDAHAQRALKVASVEGETFTAEVVAQVLNEELQSILSLLSEELDRRHHLVRAQSVRQGDGYHLSIYRFQHNLFQRYVIGSLDVVERSSLHQSVGRALQELYADRAREISGQLARQFQEAGTAQQAAEYLVQAGDRARDLYAHQEAIAYYRQAQEAYEATLGTRWAPLQRATLERKIGDSLFRKGDHEQAVTQLSRALSRLHEPLPRSRWSIRLGIVREALRQLGHRSLPSVFLRAHSQGNQAAVEEIVRAYVPIGWIEGRTNVELFFWATLRCLNIAEQFAIDEGIVRASVGLGVAFAFIPVFWLAKIFLNRAVEVGEKLGRAPSTRSHYYGMSAFKECIGDLQAAKEYAQRGIDDCQGSSDSQETGGLYELLSVALLYAGDLREALRISRNYFSVGQASADLQVQCNSECTQGGIQWRLGQLDAAASNLKESVHLSEAIPDYGTHAAASGDLGRCYLRQGRMSEAVMLVEQAVRLCQQYSIGWGSQIPAYNGKAETYLALAESANSERQSVQLLRTKAACAAALREAKRFRPGLPEAMRLQGTHSWLAGKPNAAKKWWRRSLMLAEQQAQRYDQGVAHLEMGLRLEDRVHLEQAEAILADIGAEWDLERAREALKALA